MIYCNHKLFLWAHSIGTQRHRIDGIEVRAKAGDVERIRAALDLLQEYHPAARLRVEQNTKYIVVTGASPRGLRGDGYVFTNFSYSYTDYLVAFELLLSASEVHVGRRMPCGATRRSDAPLIANRVRVALASPKHFLSWYAKSHNMSQEYAREMAEWADLFVDYARQSALEQFRETYLPFLFHSLKGAQP